MKVGGLLWGALLAIGLVPVVGCSGSEDDGIKPEVKQGMLDISTIAKKAGGDFSKLSAEDKDKVIKMAGGSEAQAKMLVYQMAHPPSEMNAGKGPGGAPPAGK